MPAKKTKVIPAVKPAVRKARRSDAYKTAVKRTLKKTSRAKSSRKVFDDPSLFGALPGMSEWAMPLLKELRDE
jgi:hypothetical protein